MNISAKNAIILFVFNNLLTILAKRNPNVIAVTPRILYENMVMFLQSLEQGIQSHLVLNAEVALQKVVAQPAISKKEIEKTHLNRLFKKVLALLV